jgi:riboflavin biosynthesis pyrimidine reductase
MSNVIWHVTMSVDGFIADPDDYMDWASEAAVATARDAAGAKNRQIFGANLAHQCLDADLLDEIVIHVAPVLLGEGVRLYGPGRQVDLDGRVTDLRYTVPKSK